MTLRGFVGKTRSPSAKLTFADLVSGNGPAAQLVSQWEDEGSPQHRLHQQLKSIPAHSAVSVTGVVREARGAEPSVASPGARWWPSSRARDLELDIRSIQVLNPFPRDIVVSKNANYPPEARHLDLRFTDGLGQRLFFRAHVANWMRQYLQGKGFLEVETPILFKSTPEGAREFLVPTRRKGHAYALPQSPQQYKQMLMASGVRAYFQIARCFRDEDLRADRQPEFTQVGTQQVWPVVLDIVG